MTRYGEEELGRLSGPGRLRDHLGNDVPVEYLIIISRGWEENPTVGGGSHLSVKHPKIVGGLTFDSDGGFIDRTSDSLTLTLADGRSVKILPGSIGSPYDPISFQVGRDGSALVADFLPPEA